MATPNSQMKNSGGNENILAIILVLIFILWIILAIMLRESTTVLGVIASGCGALFTLLGYAKPLHPIYAQFFRTLSFKWLFGSLSFTLNIILVGIILWPSIRSNLPNGILAPTEQQPSPTSSIAPTATAAALATAPARLSATTTATAFQNIYIQATSGVPAITDPLNTQDSLTWDTYPPPAASNGSCLFQNGAYYATAMPGNSTSCEATLTNFTNLALQAEVTILSENGGLIFRSNDQENSFYAFYVTADGRYFLEKSSPSSDVQDYTILISGNNSSIVHGTNQSNLLTAITRGAIFYLYINQRYVGSVSDRSYVSGAIGVVTNSLDANTTEAAFKNLKVWRL